MLSDVDYHVSEREDILNRLHGELREFNASGLTADAWDRSGGAALGRSDLHIRRQSVRHLLLSLVRQGVAVVEGIERWRATMWRNWPYERGGINYLLKMRGDTDWLLGVDGSRMLSVLRVPPEEFAYVSFTVALHAADEPGTEEQQRQEAQMGRGGRPFPAMRARMSAAAVVVASEPARQARLQLECQQLAAQGLYVPRLRWRLGGHSIVPPSGKAPPKTASKLMGGFAPKAAKSRPAWQ